MLFTRDTPDSQLLKVNPSVNKVKTFIRGPYHNLWVEDHVLSVYLRKCSHCQPLTGEPRKCLDIANIRVVHVGRGVFTSWITSVEELAREEGFEALWVENVLNPKFEGWFKARSRWIESSGFPPSYMLLLAKDNNVKV